MPRNYSNTAVETSLTNSITATATTLAVGAITGYPTTFPYSLLLDYASASQEIVLVSAAAGTTLTVTRGFNGSSASTHAAGARVVHAVIAGDLQDTQDHLAASANVHGLAGGAQVVGTTTTQTLTGKTIDGAANTFSNIPASAILGGLGASTSSVFTATTSVQTPVIGVNVDPTGLSGVRAVVKTAISSDVGLRIATSVGAPTGNALEITDSGGAVKVKATALGTVAAAGDFAAGATSTPSGTRAIAVSGAASTVPLAAQGASGQTSNLFEARDSTSAVKAAITAAGGATLAGPLTATSATLTGSLAGTSATLTGALTGTSATLNAGTGATALTMKGASGQNILTVNDSTSSTVFQIRSDGTSSAENPRGRIVGTTSCSNGNTVTISGADADYDSQGNVTSGGASVRAPRAGVYTWNAYGLWNSNSATGVRRMFVRQSGSVIQQHNMPAISGIAVAHSLSDDVELFAGETMDLQFIQSTGGTVDVSWSMSLHYLGDA